MESPEIIKLKSVNFSYAKKLVLDDLSLSILKGTVHGILGANGSGKTTLFKYIFNHYNQQQKNKIAFLETEGFFYSYMTGYEYLTLLSPYKALDLNSWNDLFQLPLDDYVHTYSTGMKKKLSIMAVLLLKREIIILDEPYNGLDLKSCEVLRYIIQRLKHLGNTVIMSSHILETVFKSADYISYLQDGHILKTYSQDEFYLLSDLIQGQIINEMTPKIDRLLDTPTTNSN
ncbi:ABC-2 type transport system ATP-binding protein [Dyadobacter jejuensis]|uniref:ABC-2 type transport system ATP-binding protein n=1 Tax=Dyadobacter jejuensis TaxID=1082580 RepID=A0A316A806_9BACT|nr:ATP-binding cassette domain-containing protein [Dyadobacter jejuensis]PWJ53753.1 ABC-2 type transport system ATP-binding protein [Dyadobacter jejuensis]